MVYIESISKARGISYNQNCDHSILAIDISSSGDYHSLNPNVFSDSIKIPIPGMQNRHSNSVLGIWEGLKIIDGKIDELVFNIKPYRRTGTLEGYQFNDVPISLTEAKKKILIPSYRHFLRNYAPEELINHILEEQRKCRSIYLFDSQESEDDVASPSSILALHLNLIIFNQPLTPINDEETRLFGILDSDASIDEKVHQISEIMNPRMMQSIEYRCVDHVSRPEDYQIARALGVIK